MSVQCGKILFRYCSAILGELSCLLYNSHGPVLSPSGSIMLVRCDLPTCGWLFELWNRSNAAGLWKPEPSCGSSGSFPHHRSLRDNLFCETLLFVLLYQFYNTQLIPLNVLCNKVNIWCFVSQMPKCTILIFKDCCMFQHGQESSEGQQVSDTAQENYLLTVQALQSRLQVYYYIQENNITAVIL
jgi:hypothetical protein